MDVIIIQMLTFLSVLFLVNGIQAVIRKENETLEATVTSWPSPHWLDL